MDKREFFEFLRDEIIEAMPELENAQFFTREVKKDNNRVYNALNIKRPELSISPSYNFDSLYNEYERTGDMYTIISLIKSGFEHMPNLRKMNIDFNDYDSIRDNITMVVRSKDRCMDIINDVPYVEQGEFIGLFKIEFQRNEHESYAALISNATLEAYGITKDELYDQAKENDKKNTYKQPILCDINDIIFNIIAGEKLFDEKNLLENNEIINIEDDELLVLSNRGSREGAALLFNEDVLERISEVMNGDYYIIPSSIHEVIVLKEMPAPELNQMIAEVNNTQVEPEDVLSYNAQYYDSRNKTLVNALSHENQQKFREMTGEISHDSEMRYEEKARKNLYLKNKEQKERAK